MHNRKVLTKDVGGFDDQSSCSFFGQVIVPQGYCRFAVSVMVHIYELMDMKNKIEESDGVEKSEKGRETCAWKFPLMVNNDI